MKEDGWWTVNFPCQSIIRIVDLEVDELILEGMVNDSNKGSLKTE